MSKIALLAALLLVACPGQVYDPCATVDDCDPEVADGCARFPGSRQGICTKICQRDADCPEGPDGEKAICRDIGKAKVCDLP